MKIDHAIRVRQGCYTMFLFRLSTEELLSNYTIASYDSVKETGYQRPPVESHYKKIARYLVAADSGQILPMAIIAAATEADIEYREGEGALTIKGRLRIVDGQHRIKAIEYLKDAKDLRFREKYDELAKDYEFPMILLLSDEVDSELEIDTFININSKGKKVSINLAKELREKKMRADLEKHKIELNAECYENLATQTVKLLAHNENSIWHERIQMGDELGFQKPVSIGTFAKSLKRITGQVANVVVNGERFIAEDEAGKTARLTAHAVEQLWKTVQERWPECFKEQKKYNLLRGFGVSVMHRLFEQCMKERRPANEQEISQDAQKMLQAAQENFAEYIKNAGIEAEDWMTGGAFTGFSSEQGYGIIVDLLRGEKTWSDLND